MGSRIPDQNPFIFSEFAHPFINIKMDNKTLSLIFICFCFILVSTVFNNERYIVFVPRCFLFYHN
jgi:hypothetical protein